MKNQRNIGLDIARCAAMAMVWICHSGYFSVGISYPFLSFAGVLCVDIFFVLSGLLVGKSLILAVTDRSPGPALKRFYINRMVRTIPIYYLMLLVTTAVYGEPVSLSYFVFLHNYQADLTGFLPQAWSLSVEAWFYFLVPPIFWILVRLFSRKQSGQAAVFQAIGLLYLIPLALRVFTVFLINPEWDAGIWTALKTPVFGRSFCSRCSRPSVDC